MGFFGRFKSDQRGTTATIFGLTVLPLFGFVGAAVDYSRAATVQTDLQKALDAAALTLVKLPITATPLELQNAAESVFARGFGLGNITSLAPLVISRDGKKVAVSRSGTVANTIMPLMGFPSTRVAGSSSATWGTQRIEVALVLDNTGSMDQRIDGTRKIDALKGQVTKALESLRRVATEADSIKVSIVPFDTEVRLDAATYRDKDWLRPVDGMRRQDWTGYVYDRRGSYAGNDKPPTDGRDSRYPAISDTEYRAGNRMGDLARGQLPTVRPLTSIYDRRDYDSLTAVVNGMAPRGFTNIALGAVWGQATLSRSEPFSEGADADDAVRKVMLILTDGDNTAHHVGNTVENADWAGSRSEAERIVTAIDSKTRTACESAKAAKIEIFTIRLLKGNEDLLRSCASGADHYSNVQSSRDLSTAFQAFIEAITRTRIVS